MRPPRRWAALGALTLALGAGACGDLDDITTVKDLRVLAVRTDPAGFLVPLDDPGSLTSSTAKVTALVVDPLQPSSVLTLTAESCPDYIDTITAASGQSSKLCPGRDVTDKFPGDLGVQLRTSELPPGTAGPALTSTIEYDPQVVSGLTPAQVGYFFAPPDKRGDLPSVIAQAIDYNRDFSLDAIVNLTFTLGTETASALKRVVYWPLFPPALLPTTPTVDDIACPTTQAPNTNPDLLSIGMFRHRVDGIPTDAYADGDSPALSVANADQLYVQPAFDPAAAEAYFLRVRNADTGVIETKCRKELLTFQFFATAGTFSPAERTSELSPLFSTPDNGHIPIDSQYKLPKAADMPADGKVTIWVVTRDERAGASWLSRTLTLTP